MDWGMLLAFIGTLFLLWITYRVLKARPELFTLENFSKSSQTLLYLAVILIAFVAFCILLLKQSP